MGWDEIERQDGFAGARERALREIAPVLEAMPHNKVDPNGAMKSISGSIGLAFAAFVVTFMSLEFLLPGGGVWEFILFLSFPLIFIGYFAAAIFLLRGRIAKIFAEAQARLGQKAMAMRTITGPLGITYVPSPGGAPKGLEWLAAQSWAPPEFRQAADTLNQGGGMDDAIAVARDSGLLIESNTYVLGSAEQKKKYAELAAGNRQIEDGFEGTRGGVRFQMFEWVEKVDEAPDIIHLIIVLQAPLRLHGRTELRSRKTGWPQDIQGRTLQDVDLGPKAFDALYRLRATDQVEARAIFNPAVIERVIALSHGGKFRGVAQETTLAFDFASGANRFQMVNLITGEWSDETIRATHADLAEALALVDTLAHAFMLARKSDTGGA